MRISAKPTDPGFTKYVTLRQNDTLRFVRIFLDGDQMRPGSVMTADDEKGMVEVTEPIKGCNHFVPRQGAVMTRMLYGHVVIKMGAKANA